LGGYAIGRPTALAPVFAVVTAINAERLISRLGVDQALLFRPILHETRHQSLFGRFDSASGKSNLERSQSGASWGQFRSGQFAQEAILLDQAMTSILQSGFLISPFRALGGVIDL